MNCRSGLRILSLGLLCMLFRTNMAAAEDFERRWSFASESSALVYWQLGEISHSAYSYLEYGRTEKLGLRTERSPRPRWSHLHHLSGLEPGVTCYYRMVNIDPATGEKKESPIATILPTRKENAVYLPGNLSGPPYVLDKPDAYYVLTKDITAEGTAFDITAGGITLDLDGHRVVFGNDTDEQVNGVRFSSQVEDKVTLCNGIIVQGRRSRDYSAAVASINRPWPTEIFGITTDVQLKCAYPVYITGGDRIDIHHNYLYSRVTEIENRHYPGNSLLRIYPISNSTGGIHVHDNLLTEGCHWGIVVREEARNVEIDHNDIQHHQQYVNGYAISPCAGADVHHNRITSTGRSLHLTRPGIRVHENYIDTQGHMDLDDLPAGSRPFHHHLIEQHGIKLEGGNVRNCKIYGNVVRITQLPPVDSDGQGDPSDKVDNGVYVRSRATLLSSSQLEDKSMSWEVNRWQNYYVKYAPDLPPAKIDSNHSSVLFANFGITKPAEYSIYMKWEYVPPTPLNISCRNPEAMNEVYGNTFIAITHYGKTRHGDYGDSGQWASAIMFVSMNNGPAADSGKYSVYVHDNSFMTNDLFLNSYSEVNMSVRIENNTFTLVGKPLVTERESRLRNLGAGLEQSIKLGGNKFDSSVADRNRH